MVKLVPISMNVWNSLEPALSIALILPVASIVNVMSVTMNVRMMNTPVNARIISMLGYYSATSTMYAICPWMVDVTI